ncbi:hypothetical protein COEREDRAFT_10262 [Coemansia reversa NRRL 1564]|uniref:Uncharacterized protein n=1 Tax=Coemansia reversa (strain ATCC 12441 / NRRL 1564) TaxID=763665 RepID=A0A2G5B671_COERN|nr:hypothetical protein COEREDRAFT_10262 [Coemansia reversa NRRL 1564]|eukprot:PIA14543.1 hypothetical protein COEREDRAFT_10262 [Coemansia reversa NRRL 1564]
MSFPCCSISAADLQEVNLQNAAVPRLGQPAIKLEEELKVVRIITPKYSGSTTKEFISSNTWVEIFRRKTQNLRKNFADCYIQAALLDLLTGQAFESLYNEDFDTTDAMLKHLCITFRKQHFQIALIKRVQSGEAFEGCTRDNIVMCFKQLLRELEVHTGGLMALAQATEDMFPLEWKQLRVDSQNLSAEEFQGALLAIADKMSVHRNVSPKLFGKAKKPVDAKVKDTEQKAESAVKSSDKADSGSSRSQHRKVASKKREKALKEEIASLKAKATEAKPKNSAGKD